MKAQPCQQQIQFTTADQHIVPGIAIQRIGTGATQQHVVAIAAIR